tara:strand:+ start:201 stop:2375 length:2175 start_codon:yes stop_codon:yes gene_type:complete
MNHIVDSRVAGVRESLPTTLLVWSWMTRTVGGWFLIIGVATNLLLYVSLWFRAPSPLADFLLSLASWVVLFIGGIMAAGRLATGLWRRLLWSVRRKLTLVGLLLGTVPVVLVFTFLLLFGLLLLFNLGSYLMQDRIQGFVNQANFFAQVAEAELAQIPLEADQQVSLEKQQAEAALEFQHVSFVTVPTNESCGASGASDMQSLPQKRKNLRAGPWRHLDAPINLPTWVPCEGFSGLIAYQEIDSISASTDGPLRVAMRAVAFSGLGWAVVVDIPLSFDEIRQLREDIGIVVGEVMSITPTSMGEIPLTAGRAIDAPLSLVHSPLQGIQLDWVTFLEFIDWRTGNSGNLAMGIGMTVAEVTTRIFETSVNIGNLTFSQVLLLILGVIGGLFLVIQGIALWMGIQLARSITNSVDVLLVGTHRVQVGDFNHKITVIAKDQLGELTQSFNSMTTSIKGLLAEKAEKDRMEQDLRIAREIQMSLLPGPSLQVPGFVISTHCVSAREVGGDYFDVLQLDDDRIAVLIADVAGKGTSAALYMAELKGIILSLSRSYHSPRDLLINANKIISEQLDSRSFITMTYAVVDTNSRTLTYARAGHTPLLHVPGPGSSLSEVRRLMPNGMALGFQLDKGDMFNQVLAEDSFTLAPGDTLVFYTDGVTEAMNENFDSFGEEQLVVSIDAHRDFDPAQLRQQIVGEIDAFVGKGTQHDDMTLIFLRINSDAGTTSTQ